MLTREELQQYKATLSEWLPPERFGHIVDGLMEQVGGVQFFTDTRIGFGRDAWVAAGVSLGPGGHETWSRQMARLRDAQRRSPRSI